MAARLSAIPGTTIELLAHGDLPDGATEVSAVTHSSRLEIAPRALLTPWLTPDPPPSELCRTLVRTHRSPVLVAFNGPGGESWLFGPDAGGSLYGPYPEEEIAAALAAVFAATRGDAAASACRRLLDSLHTTSIPGVVNSGLFAAACIRETARRTRNAPEERPKAMACGAQLLQGLGFYLPHGLDKSPTILASASGESLCVAILEDPGESRELCLPQLAEGLAAAREAGLPWLVTVGGPRIRLYPAELGLGAGYRGLANTYLEIDQSLLGPNDRPLLSALLSASALSPGGQAGSLLDDSVREAAAVAKRLRSQLLREAAPLLAAGIARAMAGEGGALDGTGLELAYSAAMRLLLRLLLQAVYEERRLLPGTQSEIRFLARELATGGGGGFWQRLSLTWKANGHFDPCGGLFPGSRGDGPMQAISLPDSVMEPVLRALLLEQVGNAAPSPIDLATLPIREIGTIYEELLEHTLAAERAEPAASRPRPPAGAAAPESTGRPYLDRTRSRRRSTGSFFTPAFLVTHLIERSLLPAIDEHLDRAAGSAAALLAAGDPDRAAAALFDFRACDLSMGAGHFLLPALDHIESRMLTLLATRPALLDAMIAPTGEAARPPSAAEAETRLRRQIAERCIYGADIDPVAVEIARFAIRVHAGATGSGLPAVEHGLVWGEALTGIATMAEAALTLGELERPEPGGTAAQESISLASSAGAHDPAAGRLRALSRLLDDTSSEHPEQPAVIARQAGETGTGEAPPIHMPIYFPEVFCREDSPGFHAILGNPPFLSQLDRNAAAGARERRRLRKHFGAKIGTQFDRSTVFLLRALELARQDRGRIGLVQPLSLLSTAQAEGCRQEVAARGAIESLWLGLDRVFPANVKTCAPSIVLGAGRRAVVDRFSGPRLDRLPAIEMDFDQLLAAPTWGELASGLAERPRVRLARGSTIGSRCSATADFRDQFYGLAASTVNAGAGLLPSRRRLITTGLIDPLESLWGCRPATINGVRYSHPAVDLDLLATENPTLLDWAKKRLVPKLLVATQSKVIEVLPDLEGRLLPSVPVITVLPDPASFWEIAAALLSPVLCSYALDTYVGSALSADAIKLSARQLLELPAPPDAGAWERSGAEAQAIFSSGDRSRAAWRRLGEATLAAYRIDDPALLAWWLARVARDSRMPCAAPPQPEGQSRHFTAS